MPALTADDVTVTLLPEDVDFTQMLRKLCVVGIAFGDGSKTYPSGGIPLPDKGRFGMSKEIRFVSFAEPANGYVYRYDKDNHKLRIFYASHDLKFINGTGGAALGIDTTNAELEVNNTGGFTITGANAATKGGVLPAALVEVPTSHTPAATTLEALVLGE